MEKENSKVKRTCAPGSTVARILALLLVICLVECATEQRINSRGSKSSNLVEKINGWRSQRGGSCLSYGHSCWGAHGKRSGLKAPVAAPDWYLTKMLRRMAANAEMNQLRQTTKNDDINAIFQMEAQDEIPSNRIGTENEENTLELSARNPEGIPMVDDDLISKMKIWQIMKATSDDK